MADDKAFRRVLRATRLKAKNVADTGGGCSICKAEPCVNVEGTYWLCGPCVAERIKPINQCDGCRRGLPQHGGIHYQLRNRGLPVIACTADRYALSAAVNIAVGAQGA